MPLGVERKPEVGELVRWAKPGPLVLEINHVGIYDLPMDAWYVRAGYWGAYIRLEPEDGVDWLRIEP